MVSAASVSSTGSPLTMALDVWISRANVRDAVCQGNVVLWKPSDTAMSASYAVYRVLRDCGLPPNIIQFLPADGPVFGDTVTSSEHLAGINFTGSVP